MIGRHPLQHRHRVEQLLAGALPLRQRGVAARVRHLPLEPAQRQPHLGGGLPAAVQVARQRLERDQPAALLRAALLLRLGPDAGLLVGGEVGDRARLGRQLPLCRRDRVELGPESDRVGRRAGALDLVEQGAHRREHAALVLDQAVEARLELALIAAQLVCQHLDPAQHHLEVLARLAILRIEPERVAQPGSRLAIELDPALRLALAERLGVAGVGQTQVIGGAAAQLVVAAGLIAGGEQLLLRLLELARRHQGEPLVVLDARGRAAAARRDSDEEEQQPRLHGDLPSSRRSRRSGAPPR